MAKTYAAALTPLREGGSELDEGAFAPYVDFLHRGGVVGIRRHERRAVRALDVMTGKQVWEFKLHSPPWAGLVSTAGGLVFGGSEEGNFFALDAASGKPLWHYPTGASIWGAAATTFMLDGRQFVLIPSGTTLVAFALPQP